MRRTRVYISGPLGTGLMTTNVCRALDAATACLERGYAVYVPHVNVLWEMVHTADIETWMAHDLAWIDACDCLLRLPGESKGSDQEVDYARARNMEVYYSLDTLFACERERREDGGTEITSSIEPAWTSYCLSCGEQMQKAHSSCRG